MNNLEVEKYSNQKKNRISFFFEKMGVPLNRGNLFVLVGGYLFCWLIIIFDRFFLYFIDNQSIGNNIPDWVVYILIVFPFAFFAFLLFFWGLNSFFSFLFHKMSFGAFVSFCVVLWLVWTYVNTLASIWLKNSLLLNGWGFIIPIVFVCIIAAYAGVQIRRYFRYEIDIRGKALSYYFLIHYSLFVLSFFYFIFSKSFVNILSLIGKEGELFIILLFLQTFVYSTLIIFTPLWARHILPK